MSTVQIWIDEPKRVIVEWNKYAPHYRVLEVLRTDARGISHTTSKGYSSEQSALAAAKRLSKKLQETS